MLHYKEIIADTAKLKVFETFRLSFIVIAQNKLFFAYSVLVSVLVFTAISYLCELPFITLEYSDKNLLDKSVIYQYIIEFIYNLTPSLIHASIVYGTMQALCQVPASITKSITHGVKRFAPVFIIVFVPLLCISIISFSLESLFSSGEEFGKIGALSELAGFALIALLLFSFFRILAFFCMVFIAIPTCVCERLGALDTFYRTRYLISGSNIRGQILALMFIPMIIFMLIMYACAPLLKPDETIQIEIFMMNAFVFTIFTVLYAVFPVVTYFRLRQIKDGAFLDNQSATS